MLLASFGFTLPLFSEKLTAEPLSGPGDFEFYFFAAERRAEAESLAKRITELEDQRSVLTAELGRAEAEAKAADSATSGKRATKLEWSAIDNVTGYSLKLFNAQKKLIDTQSTEDNAITLELEPGEYFFQVAAVTKYKTGAYSHMTRLRVSKGKPSEARLRAEESAEAAREKIRLNEKFHSGHLEMLKSIAAGSEKSGNAQADLRVPDTASYFVAIERRGETLRFSRVLQIAGRPSAQISSNAAARSAEPPSAFLWGAGLHAGIQDTRLDYLSFSLGFEAFLRHDKPFFRWFYPQLKLLGAYALSNSKAYDGQVQANLYPGVYYPLHIGKGFRLLASLSAGPNLFFVLSSAASSSVLQWGVMPAVELQYALNERTSLYTGAGINFLFDPNGILKFVPFSLGVTRHF